MTEEEFEALAQLPLHDLVDMLQFLGVPADVEITVGIDDAEPPTLHETIQNEWNW